MIIFIWIIGFVLLVVGFVGYLICRAFQPLHRVEVELMKRPDDGKHDGEEHYMKEFREIQSELEMDKNYWLMQQFKKIAVIGACIIIGLIVYHTYNFF